MEHEVFFRASTSYTEQCQYNNFPRNQLQSASEATQSQIRGDPLEMREKKPRMLLQSRCFPFFQGSTSVNV